MLRILLTIGFLQFLTMLVLVVRTKALALLLGPEMVGVMAVIDKLLAVFTQTASLSLPFAAIRFLPAAWHGAPGEYASLFRRMRNVLLAGVVAAATIAAAVTLLRPQTWGARLVPYRSIVLVAVLALPVLAFVPFLQNAIAGRLQQNRSMLFALAHASLYTVAAIVGVWWAGLRGLYVLYALAGVALVGTVTAILARRPPGAIVPAPRPFSLALPRPMWRFAAALLVLAFMAPYAALYTHYQVLSRFGAGMAGWMQAAMGISLSVRTLLGSAHQVFLTPNVNRGGAPAERMAWANEFQKVTCLLFIVALPPLLFFPGLFVRALYARSFAPGAAYVALFVAVEVVTLLAGTYQALVIAFDRLGFHVAQNLLAQLLLIGVASLLIPRYGVAGAALAALAAQAFLYAATTTFLRHAFGLRLTRRNAGLGLLVLVTLVVAGAAGRLLAEWTWSALATKAILYAAFVAAAAMLLTPADWANLRRFVRTLRGRPPSTASG
jgi:O-antigen/teichoic acid export membrane protein